MCEFDDKAATWDADPSRVERANFFAEYIRNHIDLSKVEMAMEYGCGTGLLSFSLQYDLHDITLMDESLPMVEVVNDKCEMLDIRHFHPVQYNLEKDEKPEHHFDLIYSMMTLHHIDDTQRILNLFSDISNPKAYIVLIDLVKEDGSFHNHEFEGHLGFEQNELEEMVEKSGLEVVSYHEEYSITKERDGEEKEYPLFALIARKPD